MSSVKHVAIFLIRIYQKTLSPDHGWFKRPYRTCRFAPTCSEYAIRALETHGMMAGGLLAVKRVAKCHPFHSGGVDLVPERK